MSEKKISKYFQKKKNKTSNKEIYLEIEKRKNKKKIIIEFHSK